LHGVLEQKAGDEGGQSEPAPVDGSAEYHAAKGDHRGIGLDRPLDIPLPVEFPQPRRNLVRMARIIANAVLDLPLDVLVYAFGGVLGNAGARGCRHE
jgi:hypothetical protein